MNLSHLLQEREDGHQPVRVAVIGCGKFATMYLTQARTTPGIHIVGIADLDLVRTRTNLQSAGWPESQTAAISIDAAVESGGTFLTEDAVTLIGDERIDVVVEATGIPHAGIR
ncbi:MAG: flagellar biosynthesis protein FlgA, partial [Pseudomonadota bacterium]|nr:flagellar biosynthesis protein FlgA [Pseudomonadota bacterium]